MLRITIDKTPRAITLRLEGKLTGPWVLELERIWQTVASDSNGSRVFIDLTDVTFVGEEGKKLLEAMYEEGAKLKACGCATLQLVEEIGQAFNRSHPKQAVPDPK